GTPCGGCALRPPGRLGGQATKLVSVLQTKTCCYSLKARMESENGKPPVRRCADLPVAAQAGEASGLALRPLFHHDSEQHDQRRIGEPCARRQIIRSHPSTRPRCRGNASSRCPAHAATAFSPARRSCPCPGTR